MNAQTRFPVALVAAALSCAAWACGAGTAGAPGPDASSAAGPDASSAAGPDAATSSAADAAQAGPDAGAAQVERPLFVPPAGAVADGTLVTATSATPGSTTRCTLDGTAPTAASPVCRDVALHPPVTVRAFAQAPGLLDSPIVEASYTLFTPPPSGAALGVNLGWLAPWDPTLIFADTTKHALFEGELGPDQWPSSDFRTSAFNDEGDIGEVAGTYRVRFTGQATLSVSAGTVSNVAWSSALNQTTADWTIPEGVNAYVDFRATKRVPTDAPGTGVTDLVIMRPGLPFDERSADTRFNPKFLSAIAPFSLLRGMQTMQLGYNLWDVYWSDADSNDPAWQANHAYEVGAIVKLDGRALRASRAGTSGSAAPKIAAVWDNERGAFPDGGVLWTLAARQRPTGGYLRAGPAWEELVLLANKTRAAMWVVVPYGAHRSYVTKLARALRYGTDANGEPYDAPQANPVWPGLDPGLAIYVEHSNELWNTAWPFIGNIVLADAQADVANGDPHHLLYNSNVGDWRDMPAYMAWFAVRNSLLFRQVWGDDAMGSQVRIVLAGQLDYGDFLLSNQWVPMLQSLRYVDDTWGPSSPFDAIDGLTNPKQPVGYYLYGIAGAPYLHFEGVTLDGGGSAADVDRAFQGFRTNLERLKPAIDSWKHYAGEHGIKFLTYEGGTEIFESSATIDAAWTDPRMRALLKDLASYVWTPAPPAPNPNGYLFDASVVDAYTHYTMLGNGTFGLSSTLEDTSTERWQAMQELASGL